MKRSQMNQQQIRDREEVLFCLLEAGWESDPMNDNFDEGLWCHSEAIFHYSNKNALDLQVEYYTEDRSLYFSFFDDSGDGMGLLFKFESSLSPLLDSITDSQDKLSLENYKQYIKQWVEIYPNAYVQYDDDLVPLTLD